MYKKVIFFNPFHNGDIHFSREFVKKLVSILPAKEYVYQHNNYPDLIADIQNIKHERYKDLGWTHPKGCHMYYELQNNILKLNTWAAVGKFWDIYKREGITLSNNIKMYNYTLSQFTDFRFEDTNLEQYIPSIDYTYFRKRYPRRFENIDNFVLSENRKKILICNGNILSNQCPNFAFGSIVSILAQKFPDFLFLLTDKKDIINEKNVKYTSEIIGNDQCLNSISYLGMFTDVLIGRSSGPYSTCNVKETWIPKKQKTIIGIVNIETDAFWHIPVNSINKFIWLNKYDNQSLIIGISKVLK